MFSVLRPTTYAVLATLALAVATAAGRAATTEVTVDGTNYSFSVFVTSYEDNAAALQATPWWGNAQLAIDVITQHLIDNISPDGHKPRRKCWLYAGRRCRLRARGNATFG